MQHEQWIPHPGPQTVFHECPAYECMFGGTKGPGKTESLLREALRQIENPHYRAIIFRRTFPRLGEIIDRSFKYFKRLKLLYSAKDMQLGLPAWTAPSGAKIAFGHIQYEQDKYSYQGKEFHFMGFDQLEEFTETQYLFLMAQNRTSDATIRCYIRSTANPGGVGHGWVKKRFIDSLKPNETRYFKRVNDDDMETNQDDPQGLSRCFIPATIWDNPSLITADPGYMRRLEQLPEEDKKALLYGDWNVFRGQYFSMWRNSVHVREKTSEPQFRKFLSLDYGYANPSSVGWWMVDYDGQLHRYRELYKEQCDYEKLAQLVKEKTPTDERMDYCVADPAIWGDKTHHKNDGFDGESGAETMQRVWNGFTSLIKGDNDRLIGWGRMRIMLKHGPGQPPQLTCSPECRDSIRTIPNLIHDDIRVEDLNTDGEDHAADDWRMAVMSRTQATLKEKLRSKDRAMPLAGELIETAPKDSWKEWMR